MLLSIILGGDFSWITLVGYIVAVLINIFFSLPVHECAHAFAAYKLGDNTAKYSGRLTLNPFAHIDYLGAFLMIFVGFGWAKPVPVDMRRFKNPKRDMALTALAGPVSNILLAFVALVLSHLFLILSYKVSATAAMATSIVATIFYWTADINVYLGIFNLVPIPPLDGSRILNAFLSDRVYYKLMKFERYSFIIVIALAYLFGDALNGIASFVFKAISNLAFLPFQPFLG